MHDDNENANDLTGLDVSATDGAPISDSETEKIVAILDDTTPKKRIKKRYICFALIALALGGAGIAWGMSGSSQPEQPAEGNRPVVVTEKKKAEKADLNLHVNADGWSADSTPVIVHIESEDGKVDAYHAFKANEDCAVEAAPGTYKMTYISPINADGSIYKTPDPQEARVSGKEDKQAEATLATFEKIPADEVTQEQIDSILSQIKDAVIKGDKTLSGDTGKEIVDTAASNAAAAPNVDKEKATQLAEEAKQLVQETPPASTTTNNSASNANTGSSGTSSSGSSNNTQSSGSNSGSSAPNNGGSTGGNSNGGSTTAPDPAPAPTPTPDPTPEPPAHQHNWVAQTEIITHPAEYEQQWVSNMVYVPQYTCGTCGAKFSTSGAADTHLVQSGRGGCGAYYSSGYYEDQGSYQSVLIRDAWSETVTTGYACSGCGAWK